MDEGVKFKEPCRPRPSASCGATEHRMRPDLHGGFQQEGVEGVARVVLVAAPGEGGLPVPALERPVVAGGGGQAALVALGLLLLGAADEAIADLEGPDRRGVVAGPAGV